MYVCALTTVGVSTLTTFIEVELIIISCFYHSSMNGLSKCHQTGFLKIIYWLLSHNIFFALQFNDLLHTLNIYLSGLLIITKQKENSIDLSLYTGKEC